MTTAMATRECVHRWRIEERVEEERFSPGRCQRCGAERKFDNWSPQDVGGWKERSDMRVRPSVAKRAKKPVQEGGL